MTDRPDQAESGWKTLTAEPCPASDRLLAGIRFGRHLCWPWIRLCRQLKNDIRANWPSASDRSRRARLTARLAPSEHKSGQRSTMDCLRMEKSRPLAGVQGRRPDWSACAATPPLPADSRPGAGEPSLMVGRPGFRASAGQFQQGNHESPRYSRLGQCSPLNLAWRRHARTCLIGHERYAKLPLLKSLTCKDA